MKRLFKEVRDFVIGSFAVAFVALAALTTTGEVFSQSFSPPVGGSGATACVQLSNLSLAGVTSVQDTSHITSSYSSYLLRWNNVVTGGTTNLAIFFSTNAGSTWDTTATNYHYNNAYSGAVSYSSNTGSGAYVDTTNPAPSTTGSVSGWLYFSPNVSGRRLIYQFWNFMDNNTAGETLGGQGVYVGSTSVVNGIQFGQWSGSIAYSSGNVVLYGCP